MSNVGQTVILLLCLFSVADAQEERPSGDAVIRAPFAGSEIVITTTSRLAGAIHSLTWSGQEFINSADHGRQLQSASNFDAGSAFSGETFNPTEAGSRFDGAGKTSTSRLLHLVADKNKLQSTIQMAFWLRPGEKSSGQPAKNSTALSNHLLTKRVQIGYRNLPNVIQYEVTFGLPINEHHQYAQFEAITGYMPPEFHQFRTLDPATGQTNFLSDGPGEQSLPVILATETGSHAMGVYSPQQPSPGFANAGYGRWNFRTQQVVKWNCVFRHRDPQGLRPRDFSFRCFVVIGELDTVAATMQKLHQQHTP